MYLQGSRCLDYVSRALFSQKNRARATIKSCPAIAAKRGSCNSRHREAVYLNQSTSIYIVEIYVTSSDQIEVKKSTRTKTLNEFQHSERNEPNSLRNLHL